MEPRQTGEKYDRIARWWHERHQYSQYGVAAVTRALDYLGEGAVALDAGCGAGGRMVRLMEDRGLTVTGVDVSAEMIALAKAEHPEHTFIHQDICTFKPEVQYDFILAWDSLFHLPFSAQEPVIAKLSNHVAEGGILLLTCGNDCGEHTDSWMDDTFYYSSIGINRNLQIMMSAGLTIVHTELDQYPQKHVLIVARRQ